MISMLNKPRSARQLKALLFDVDGNPKAKQFGLFEEACQAGRLRLADYNVQSLAREFIGGQWRDENVFRRVSLMEQAERYQALMEAGTPVSSSFFPQITSQLLFSEVRRSFEMESNVFGPLLPVVKTRLKGTEIVPAVTNPDPRDVEIIGEGQEYQNVGVSEETFTYPEKDKRGLKMELTREGILFDQTGLLVKKAQAIGKALGAVREDQSIDVITGQTNNYIRNDVASNTYNLAGVINNQSGLPLNDWTDIDTARQLFVDIRDPNTNQPITRNVVDLIVMPFKEWTAKRILNATAVRTAENLATPNRSEETLSPNPLAGAGLRLHVSDRFFQRVQDTVEPVAATAREGWFLGNIAEAFGWLEIWPLELLQQSGQQGDGWERDVSMKWKSSYFGVAYVRERRRMLRLENVAW